MWPKTASLFCLLETQFAPFEGAELGNCKRSKARDCICGAIDRWLMRQSGLSNVLSIYLNAGLMQDPLHYVVSFAQICLTATAIRFKSSSNRGGQLTF